MVDKNYRQNEMSIVRSFRGESNEMKQEDLVCLSHLRWDFVYQRPQHLLSRAARDRRVFFVEEPIFDNDVIAARLDRSEREDKVYIVVPHLPARFGGNVERTEAALRELIEGLFDERQIDNYILWYYTPMAVAWTEHLQPSAVIYDCMDELSAFKGAPPELLEREAKLLQRADAVFTGGQSLYEAKRNRHPNAHPFPSSIDRAHFAAAREIKTEPEDQILIPHPRLGFFGVVDERFDIELVRGISEARPHWHLVLIGPVVKIDPATLPNAENIHYLGGKTYNELPAYLAGWDVAMLTFALNESTRFISPTKTPEYLAAGKRTISTSIRDVVRPYGEQNLVRIADTVDEWIIAIEASLADATNEAETREWLRRVDAFLAGTSWDRTWDGMNELIKDAIAKRHSRSLSSIPTIDDASVAALATSTERAVAAGSNTIGD